MILLAYFGVFFVFLARRRAWSPALTLAAIYIFSLLCGLLLGYHDQISSVFEGFNLLFVALMLTLLIAPWNSFRSGIAIAAPNERRILRLTRLLLAINALGFVVFSLAFYGAITTVVDYSAFKNDVGPGTLYADIGINHTIHVLAIYLNPTAAFLVPLHFYHLWKRRYGLALLCLTLSLNVVLEGISIFSRSTLILYFVLYLLYLPLFYGRLDRGQRRVLSAVGLVLMTLSGTIFYKITSNRFSDYYSGATTLTSISSIQSPLVYSVLDYAAQWHGNSNEVMAQYSFRSLRGQLSFPIVATVGNKVGLMNYSPEVIPEKLQELWGDRFDKFVGVIANLVIDLGYAGATIFVLLYALVVWKLRPVGGSISIATFLVLGTIFILPAMGIQNSAMKSVGYNLLIIYSIAVYAYLYTRRPVWKANPAPMSHAIYD